MTRYAHDEASLGYDDDRLARKIMGLVQDDAIYRALAESDS